MKKVISIICVFTMLTFSLISCGKQSTDVNPSNTLDNNNVVEVTNTKDEEMLAYESRSYRLSETYTDYAKDLCTNYKIDLRRYNLCVTQKRYIGVYGKHDFDILKEDLKFLNDCLKTVLKSYGAYFNERYIDGLSFTVTSVNGITTMRSKPNSNSHRS